MADTPKIGAPFEAQFHEGRMQEWIIQRLIRQIHTATLVKVLKVYPTAGAVGFVDVRPLIQQQTTNDVVIDSAPMYRMPFMRVQGGQSALIIDPVEGDLGLAVFCERDITAVVRSQSEGPAPTNRAYDAGDGVYLGGFLNQDPEQWLKFAPTGGSELVSPLFGIRGEVTTTDNVKVGTGASGQFTTPTGQTVTVQDGIITNIY